MTENDKNTVENVTGLFEEHYCSIVKYLIVTVLTCGLFNLYWNHRQMQACNDLLDEKEFSFWFWLLITIITFGLYHIYYQYKMGRAITNIQADMGLHIFEILPLISVVATLFGLSILVDCIHQYEINKIVNNV